jgi:hypothetical protein
MALSDFHANPFHYVAYCLMRGAVFPMGVRPNVVPGKCWVAFLAGMLNFGRDGVNDKFPAIYASVAWARWTRGSELPRNH